LVGGGRVLVLGGTGSGGGSYERIPNIMGGTNSGAGHTRCSGLFHHGSTRYRLDSYRILDHVVGTQDRRYQRCTVLPDRAGALDNGPVPGAVRGWCWSCALDTLASSLGPESQRINFNEGTHSPGEASRSVQRAQHSRWSPAYSCPDEISSD